MSDLIMTLYYSNDPFSKKIIQLLERGNISYDKLPRIRADHAIVKEKILRSIGDITIPALIVKDPDDKMDIITGNKLRQALEEIIRAEEMNRAASDIPQIMPPQQQQYQPYKQPMIQPMRPPPQQQPQMIKSIQTPQQRQQQYMQQMHQTRQTRQMPSNMDAAAGVGENTEASEETTEGGGTSIDDIDGMNDGDDLIKYTDKGEPILPTKGEDENDKQYQDKLRLYMEAKKKFKAKKDGRKPLDVNGIIASVRMGDNSN